MPEPCTLDLYQAYEYAVAMEANLHSVAVDLADWVAEHGYVVPVCYKRFHELLEQYAAACKAAGR